MTQNDRQFQPLEQVTRTHVTTAECAFYLNRKPQIRGYTARFTTAGELLGDLAALDSDTALRRRLRLYAVPDLLVIDEIGYLSYSNRHADLLFELVSRRYETKSTIVTTNRPFAEWPEVFPNAACVVSLVDRLVHHSEVIAIEGESLREDFFMQVYRLLSQAFGRWMTKPLRHL